MGDARALFFPPSFGMRCPEGAEVGLGLSSPSANPLPFQRKGIDQAWFLLSNFWCGAAATSSLNPST